jgi:hypothetical protein
MISNDEDWVIESILNQQIVQFENKIRKVLYYHQKVSERSLDREECVDKQHQNQTFESIRSIGN